MESKEIHRLLPEEIITDILSILPVKSLLRFKCVSKSWRRLISSRYFIKTHLQNSKKNETFDHTTMIISAHLKTSTTGGMIKACSLWSLLMEPVTHASPLGYIFPRNRARHILIVGSCNGLICVLVEDNYQDEISLWNPATRVSKELPCPFAGVTGVDDPQDHCLENYGFGFDESSGDYKVYTLFDLFPTEPIWSAMGRMYSLKSDSWGETTFYDNESYPLHGTIEAEGKFVSGKLHWTREKIGTESKWEIAFLDLKSETFGVVEKPSFMEDDFVPRLGVLNGCLCLFCDCPNRYEMWIWNKYGVEDSWVKFASMSHSSDSWKNSFMAQLPPSSRTYLCMLPNGLCMLPNGEVLFTYRTSECLLKFVIYNPKDNGCSQRCIDNFEYVDQVVTYSESVVSLVLDDGDGDEGEASLGIMV